MSQLDPQELGVLANRTDSDYRNELELLDEQPSTTKTVDTGTYEPDTEAREAVGTLGSVVQHAKTSQPKQRTGNETLARITNFDHNPETMAFFLTVMPIVLAAVAGIATGASSEDSCPMVSNASMKSYTFAFSALLLALGAALVFICFNRDDGDADGVRYFSIILCLALIGLVIVALVEYFSMSSDKRDECQNGHSWTNIMFFILVFVSLVGVAGTAYINREFLATMVSDIAERVQSPENTPKPPEDVETNGNSTVQSLYGDKDL